VPLSNFLSNGKQPSTGPHQTAIDHQRSNGDAGHEGGTQGEDDEEKFLRTCVEAVQRSGRPAIHHAHELSDRLHDRRFGGVILLSMEQVDGEIEIGRFLNAEAASPIIEASFDRVHRNSLESSEFIGAVLGFL
jgi:imidazolonepropionase-like amidohydrolase